MDYDSMTVRDLRQYAADNNIDLGAATRKADVIAAIEAAAMPPETAVSALNDEAGENTTPTTESADTGANDTTEKEEKEPSESETETPEETAAEIVTETSTIEIKDKPPDENEAPPENEPQNPPALFTLNRVLLVMKPLIKGSDVRAIQAALIARGYHVGARGADGIYTKDTAKAVRHFQASNGFNVNGKVAKQTAAALGAAWEGR